MGSKNPTFSISARRVVLPETVTYDEEFLRTIGQFWTVSFSLRTKVSQTLQSVLCITTNKYLLVVLLHARFSVVGPIPFLLAAIFFPGHPSTTVLPDSTRKYKKRIRFLQATCKILISNL